MHARGNVLRVIALLVGTALVGIVTPITPAKARAISMAIDQPLPEDWQAPVRAFLQRLGASNIEELIRATRTVCGTGRGEFLLFRVQHPESCHDDSCLTVVGRLQSGILIADQMFFANGWYIQGDVAADLWGTPSFPMIFPNGDAALTLARTAQGWVLFPNKNKLPSDFVSPVQSVEQCARSLGRPTGGTLPSRSALSSSWKLSSDCANTLTQHASIHCRPRD
jgi:hypothetical protein